MNMIHVILLCLQLLLFRIPSSSNVISFTPPPSFPPSGPSCFGNERLALLQMKKDFSSSYGPSDSSLLSSWKPRTNCCSWEGVTCDKLTGHVTGLDLSGRDLSGLINSTIFLQLSHLQQLSLADNNFQLSPIPSRLDLLPNLTHLNLSHSNFSGQVPLGVSRLTKLVSLDLSCYHLGSLKLEDPNLGVLVTDLHNLRELFLDGVNISANGSDWCSSLPLAVPKLQVLSLSYTQLSGPICKSLRQLQLLSTLHLDRNNFSSEMPKKIMLLPELQSLDVSGNRLLSGTLPEFPTNNVLEFLSLQSTSFYGQLPDSIGNLKLLKELDLSNCNFSGLIPYPLAHLSQITHINLSSNHFQGWLPFLQPMKNGTKINASNRHNFLQSLEFLSIDNNSMEATLDPSMFTLPSLRELYLRRNLLSGALKTFHASSSLLEILDLSFNNLEGQIPNSIFHLQHLHELQLFSNNFSGMVDAGMFKNLKSLQLLDLSGNKRLMISDSSNSSQLKLKILVLNSCNISEFPHFLRNQVGLVVLDLSDNKIHGQIPNWIWHEKVRYLNLSHNFLTGMQTPIPFINSSSLDLLDFSSDQLEGDFPDLPLGIKFLLFSKNKLTGEMPLSICNMSRVDVLDLSNNQLRGQVPKCLEKTRGVMSLRGNHFHGTLSWNFSGECSLKTLDIYNNKLEGKVPRSLINCKELEVLDLGDNQINDIFPSGMGNLPNLQVLILQANKFHGLINQHLKKEDFPMLHILDLSSNSFTGNLPNISWMSMIQKSKENDLYVEDYPQFFSYYFRDRMSMTNKGIKMEEIPILTMFNVLDFSNNQFQGQIPEVIGNLTQLQVLNLSRNNLMGQIPSFLAKLSLLESLELSGNKLSGEIPSQLTNLTFLEVLNLSYNQLVGRIPLGNQFSTFNNDSYKGNLGLCGSPLSRQCDDGKKNTSRTAEEGNGSDSVIPIDWKFVIVGYGFGAVVAATINFIMFSRCKIYAAWIERVIGRRRARRNRGRRGGRTTG